MFTLVHFFLVAGLERATALASQPPDLAQTDHQKHSVVYKATEDALLIAQLRYHYR